MDRLLSVVWSGNEGEMGRLFRFLKITGYLTFLFGGILVFSAFRESPGVEQGLGEGIQKSIVKQIENGQSLTNKLMSAVTGEPVDLKQKTEWFHQKVAEQKEADYEANERRENSYIYHHNGKKWVFIQGKYYEYNPDNIYVVNGIKTFYEPPSSNKKPRDAVSKRNYQKVTATRVVREKPSNPTRNLPTNPLGVYSKDGMAQLKQNLNQIQVQMKQRNEALKALSKEQ